MYYRTLNEDEYRDLEDRILYEDNHLLIVNKRAGEIVQGDRTGDECLAETLKAFVAQRDGKPGQVFMGIPHRLDRPVSGIVVFAKTSKALERMTALFREGSVHKTYWALCCSAPAVPEAELEDWLVRNEKLNKTFIAKTGAKNRDAKPARLRYRYLCHTERYHLLEVELLTGRHHQIRCLRATSNASLQGVSLKFMETSITTKAAEMLAKAPFRRDFSSRWRMRSASSSRSGALASPASGSSGPASSSSSGTIRS